MKGLFLVASETSWKRVQVPQGLRVDDRPFPSVQAGGAFSVGRHQYHLELRDVEDDVERTQPSKPPYRVPTMAEIAARPRNGFKVISTFSGCGGSCLGFEMEGFEVLWASEFIPAAQDTYRLNHPGVHLDTRDIRQVTAEGILRNTGLERGEADVLEGSPPCASFSTAGKREAGWGKVKAYSDSQQRTDDLFFEYARLLEGLQPKVFVAENVSGLVKGVAKGYFKRILARLRECGYRVEARVLDAQWLGVPQTRQRVIFVGVREDLGVSPAFPKPLPYRYTVRDAIPWIVSVYDGKDSTRSAQDAPSPTVLQSDGGRNTSSFDQGLGRVEARVIHDMSGQRSQGDVTDRPCPAITVGVHSLCSQHFRVETPIPPGDHDPDACGIEGQAIGREWDQIQPGEQSERYFNLVKPGLDEPSPTVTQMGGNLGMASVVHPTEKRKFTIVELRRICGFPDDFQLTGSYEQKWERLGRAVPPVMMAHVARVVRDEVLAKVGGGS